LLIQALADQMSVPAEEKFTLGKHLTNCGECNKYAVELSSLESSLRNIFHTDWDKQQPDPNLQAILHPNPAKLLWNNFFGKPGMMGKATLVGALLVGYFVIANMFGIQTPISSDETATTLPTPNEFASMYSTSPTPSAPTVLTDSVIQACETVIYLVQVNDTLVSIAFQHGVTEEAIREYNHLTSNTIFANTELIIPLCNSTPSHTATLPDSTTLTPPINGTIFPTQPQ
jgi:LysM repeat protein